MAQREKILNFNKLKKLTSSVQRKADKLGKTRMKRNDVSASEFGYGLQMRGEHCDSTAQR